MNLLMNLKLKLINFNFVGKQDDSKLYILFKDSPTFMWQYFSYTHTLNRFKQTWKIRTQSFKSRKTLLLQALETGHLSLLVWCVLIYLSHNLCMCLTSLTTCCREPSTAFCWLPTTWLTATNLNIIQLYRFFLPFNAKTQQTGTLKQGKWEMVDDT